MTRIIRWIFPLLFFFAVLLFWVRILLTPLFIEAEYRRPGFPADTFGFTTEQRLYYANLSREYLLSNAGSDFFAAYKLPDGSPMYNERELSHMRDVQLLAHQAMNVWAICGVLLLVCGAYIFWKERTQLWAAIAASGKFTVSFLIVGIVLVSIFWNSAFVLFHRIFFTGDTWLFYYSDTLIRLFPTAFWQDVFVVAAVGTLLTGLFAWLIFRRK